MQLIQYPDRSDFKKLCQRPVQKSESLEVTVSAIFKEVQKSGDAAVRSYSLAFDGVDIPDPKVNLDDYNKDFEEIPSELKNAIETAYKHIYKFHQKQQQPEWSIETMEGVVCSQKSVGIERVGIYIPGGTAPLFSSVLMLAIPAKIAGCREIVLCTPPNLSGRINPVIAWCAKHCGVTEIFATGGAQAIAMMSVGTDTCASVYKIFGPGNQYVTAAKQHAAHYGVAADMPAGPSEVLVFADESGIPEFIASDLLAQAEHGTDSQVILVSLSEGIARKVIQCLKSQISSLPRRDIAEAALDNSRIILMNDLQLAFEFINLYGPEHLIVASENAEQYINLILNAGSVFLGNYTPESAGDYASGTNHTLPTNGWARSFSGLNVDAFCKKITFQTINQHGLNRIAPVITEMALAESLQAHANAVTIRTSHKNQL